MEQFVLKPEADCPDIEELLPAYLIQKAKEHHSNGKTVWLEDVITGERHTFGNFNAETRSVASFLYRNGMRKGETALFMTNDLVKCQFFLVGTWRLGGIARASYPEDDAETLLFRIKESHIRWVICDPEKVELVRQVVAELPWDVMIISSGDGDKGVVGFTELFADDGSQCPKECNFGVDHPATILCTSGTTGKSKGAVHTHRTFVNSMNVTVKHFPFAKDRPNLILSKATHISGCLFPLVCMAQGCKVLVMAQFTKQNLFESVHKHKPGFVWGFPTFLLQMVQDPEAAKYDFSSVKAVASGGAQITPAMRSEMKKLPNLESFHIMYGLTESAPVAMRVDLPEAERLPPFSVGKTCPGCFVTIRDLETGKVLGPNERGEICAKTVRNFTAYINNPEATKNTFIDGYLRSGDIGYFNENGFIFVVDRLKEIFKYYNNHISPTELEEVIMQHEGVNEVCVFGVPDAGGHVPRAVVTVKHPQVKPEDILEFANSKLPDYKRIRGGIFIVPELPKGKTGKITRNLVAEMRLPNGTVQ